MTTAARVCDRVAVWAGFAMLLGLFLVATAALALLAPQGFHGPDSAASAGPASASAVSAAPDRAKAERPPAGIEPVAVEIPSVGVDSALVPLGLNPDQSLEVPSDFAVAGWYTYRVVPGEPGPSIIAGHVDSRSGPAVFDRLGELEPGATIEIARSDGSFAVFTVTGREQYDKDAFPTERVYGPTDSPKLRLITCGGEFDRSAGHYDDNVIVFADLDHIVDPPSRATGTLPLPPNALRGP